MHDLSLAFPQFLPKQKGKRVRRLYWNSAILVLIIGLAIMYLMQINSLSTKGYEIRQLEQQTAQLELEQKHLELESSALQSIDRIQSEASRLNLVPTTNVTYVNDSNFALK